MGQTSKMAENTLTKKCTIYPYVTSPFNWTRLNITWRGVSKLITWLLINLTFFGGNASVRTRLSVSEGRHRWLNNTPLSNVNVVLITTHTIRFHKIYSNDLHSRLNVLRPRQDVSVFVWKTEIFISDLAYRPHVSGENGHRKPNFSKTHSGVEILENTGFSFPCGRTKTEVFEYDDVIHHILLELPMLRKWCCRISID